MVNPEACVVVVTYNSAEWVDQCLRALVVDSAPTISTEVVVVDNGSGQETRDVLDAWSGDVRVHYADANLGFGRACNLAASLSDARHVILVNPDALVQPGCIDALVTELNAYPGAGLMGGRTLRPDGTTDPGSCWGRPTLWSWFCFATGLSSLFRRSMVFDPESLGRWDRSTPREVGMVTGCLLAASRSTWDALGGFDERYFMYGEDADLSIRAAQFGFRPRITPRAVAMHAVGTSSSSKASRQRLLMTGRPPSRGHGGVWRRACGSGIPCGRCGRCGRVGECVRRTPSPRWIPLVRDRSWIEGWSDPRDPVTTGG